MKLIFFLLAFAVLFFGCVELPQTNYQTAAGPDFADIKDANDGALTGSKKIFSSKEKTLAIIGDDNSSSFKPQLKIVRKNFEDSNFTMEFNDPMSSASVSIDKKVVKSKTADKEIWFYDLPASAEVPEGGFEYLIRFNSKPSTNCFSFTINAPNLDFFYQPPLEAKDEFKGLNCNATTCLNGSFVVAERPLNVVGSYAIYHKSKINNQYETGKYGHLYTPFMNDSNGNLVWGDLSVKEINNSIFNATICIPQKYMDNAIYPIYLDPSIGYTTVGGTGANWLGNSIRANYAFTPATDGTLTSFSVWHYIGTIGVWRPVIYLNSTNAVRAYGYQKAQGGSEAWDEQPYEVGTLAISAGTYYMLGLWLGTSPNINGLRYDEGGTSYAKGAQTFSNVTAPDDPQTWGSGKPVGGTQYHFSMYANYTENAPSFTPAFYVNISAPLNNTGYESGHNFQLNITIYGNATGYNASYSLDGAANTTIGNIVNGTINVTTIGVLATGLHNITVIAQNGTVVNNSYVNFSVAAAPPAYALNISFVSPTPSNGSENSQFYVNMTQVGGNFSMLDLNRSLVLWQRFDGISGGTYLQDNSTWNNSFVNTTNGGFSSFEQQGFGTSFTPNDTSKGIKGPNNSIVGLTLNNGKNFTVTFWANMSRRAAGDNWATAFAISPSGGYGNPRLWVRKLVGVIGVELINSTGQGETIDYVYLNLPSEQYKLNDSTWHFYAAKFMRESTDSSNMTVYTFRDGANPMNNKSVLGINFGGNFSIGSFSGGTFPFNDTLDEFMIFDRGLSNAEIQALYNGSNYAQNFTDNFSGGNYTLQGYVVNTSGAMNTTGLINFNFTKTSGGAPAAFVPAFQVNISKPLNNTDYTYGYNFTLNVSVWGNATGYNASYSFDGLANVTLGNIANGSANFTVLGILAAGLHNITVYAQNGTVVNQSYANFSVAKYTQWANLTLGGSEANRTITYETTNTATGSGSNVTGTLYRDGVAITDPDTNQIYGNATYNFTYVTEGNANYTLASKTWFLKVNKAVPTLTISLVPSSGVYGTPANATGSGCTSLYSQLTCQVNHKDETDVTYNTQANAVNQTYAVGVHTLNYTTAGNANYTSASSSNAQITITQYTQWANLTLGGSEANRTITFGTTNTASGSASNVTGTLYRDGTSISNPDTDQVYGNGTYNFTYVTAGNRNYSSAFKTWFLKVNKYDQWCNVTINTVEGNVTIWEGTQSTATGSASNVTGTLYRNTSSVSNPDVQTLANATYNYTYVSAGNTNYTACSKTWYLFVNAAPFSPAFIVNITHPVNNTAYDCGGSFTAYFNITGNASTYDTKYSFDGAANVSSGNVANNSNTSINLGVLIAGLHNLTVFGTNGTVTNFTYANFSINTCTGDNPPSFGACTFISPIQMGMLNNYSVPITDDNGVSACIWSFNYGGTFANETAIAAGSATSYQCNITKAFPFPSNVSIKVYANDTAGQWNFSCVTEVHVIPSGPDVNPYGIIAIGMAGMSLSYWAYRKSRQG